MPHKHIVKTYVKDGVYHVYNRGVEKREIFLDDQDYRVFLHLLKYYLSPENSSLKHPLVDLPNYRLVRPRPLANLSDEVSLTCYCLMPNHFHLLLKQKTIDGMPKLLRKLSTTYSMYFNKRYHRVGHLFQGHYKAALVTKDEYLLHLSRYIHTNQSELTGWDPVNYPYSSYPYLVGLKKASWIKPDMILKFFDRTNLLPFLHTYPSYKKFVENYRVDTVDTKELLGDLTIEG